MDLLKELEDLGVNVDEGLARVMGDKDLYLMMLNMFIDSVSNNRITLDEFGGNDLTELITKVHSLKGTTGNLSITPLFNAYNESLTLLREEKAAQARAAYEKALPVQEKIIECIQKHRNS